MPFTEKEILALNVGTEKIKTKIDIADEEISQINQDNARIDIDIYKLKAQKKELIQDFNLQIKTKELEKSEFVNDFMNEYQREVEVEALMMPTQNSMELYHPETFALMGIRPITKQERQMHLHEAVVHTLTGTD